MQSLAGMEKLLNKKKNHFKKHYFSIEKSSCLKTSTAQLEW